MDAAAKKRVHEALLAAIRSNERSTDADVHAEETDAQIDQDESYAVDDLWQADQAGDLRGVFEEIQETHDENLEAAEALDVSLVDVVAPGAIVTLGDEHFIIGARVDEFDCDGVTYTGMSTDAPLYEAIQGKKAGDSYEFNGSSYRIDEVV